MQKPLVISNFDPLSDDVIYDNDVGSWNVSRALRDCLEGKHKVYLLDVFEAYQANAGVTVDEAKVAELMAVPEFEPGIGIVEDGKVWLIDGHHRLRALSRRGAKDFTCWIIEEADARPYQIFYNGERKSPFPTYSK
jgi:ParB-like nuclease domain